MPHHSKAPLLKEHRVSTVTYSITQWPGPHQHLFHSSFFPLADRSNSAMVKGVDNMLIKEQIHKFDIISACATPSSSHQFLQITETPQKNKVACCPMRQTKDRYSGYIVRTVALNSFIRLRNCACVPCDDLALVA